MGAYTLALPRYGPYGWQLRLQNGYPSRPKSVRSTIPMGCLQEAGSVDFNTAPDSHVRERSSGYPFSINGYRASVKKLRE